VQAIVESTQALEAELERLKRSEKEKDREIAALRDELAAASEPRNPPTHGPVGQLDAAFGAALDDATDAVEAIKETEAAVAEAYHIMTPAFAHLRRAFAKGCGLPVVGGAVRVSLKAADACVGRVTKWSSCEHFGRDIDGLLQYVDERVLTPHLCAAKAGSQVLCEPLLRRADPLLAKGNDLFKSWRPVPRGFAEALGRRVLSPAQWLREALRAWYGTPPGRLAMEDKLSKSTATATAEDSGGVRLDSNGETGSTVDASRSDGCH